MKWLSPCRIGLRFIFHSLSILLVTVDIAKIFDFSKISSIQNLIITIKLNKSFFVFECIKLCVPRGILSNYSNFAHLVNKEHISYKTTMNQNVTFNADLPCLKSNQTPSKFHPMKK